MLWPRTPDSQLTPGTTPTTTTTAAAVTTTTTAAAVADEEADTGSAAATATTTPPDAETTTTTTTPPDAETTTTTTTPPDAETTTTTTTPPDAETTTTTTTPPDAETTTTTTATTLAAVGEPPTFRVITPTHLWPENPNAGVLGAARQSLFAWERIRGFWAWYLTEGHAQAHGFDAASRPELSEIAAEQVNWVHHRFWSEVLPTWDRVWNDEFAKERERQREWIMTAFGKKVYNAPGDGYDPRYWGPRGHSWVEGDPGGYYPAMLPLVDLDGVAAWMATRGLDLDAVAQRYYEAEVADARAEGVDIFPYISEWSDTGFGAETLARALAADVYDEEAKTLLRRSPVADALDPNLDIWKEWAASVDLEAMLGPQAAGGKMGPSSGEMWYQWHPEGMDVSTVNPDYKLNGEVYIKLPSVFQWFPNWWPERLEVPVHDPAQASIGGTIAPRNPDTGNFYFEVCLWASGGLFGPWSLPHPELPDASANTTWWITGLADPHGTILEISLTPEPSVPVESGPVVLRAGMGGDVGPTLQPCSGIARPRQGWPRRCRRNRSRHTGPGVSRHAGPGRSGVVAVAGEPQPRQRTPSMVGLETAPRLHRSPPHARHHDPPPVPVEPGRRPGRFPGRGCHLPVEVVACGTCS